MQVRISPTLMQLLRDPGNQQLRGMIEALRTDPEPGWTQPTPERPGRREFLFEGHTIVYTVDDSEGERIIRVTIA